MQLDIELGVEQIGNLFIFSFGLVGFLMEFKIVPSYKVTRKSINQSRVSGSDFEGQEKFGKQDCKICPQSR